MTHARIAALVLTLAVLIPATARADGFLSPYIGVNFGGDTTTKSTTVGGALGFIGTNAGVEVDLGYTPEFYGDDTLDVDGKVVTLMGNVLLGGRHKGFSPYVAFGAGLIRTNISAVTVGDVFDTEAVKNSIGGNLGGGFFAGSRHVTVRGDVRYFRAFSYESGLSDLDITSDKLSFWRGTVGLGLIW